MAGPGPFSNLGYSAPNVNKVALSSEKSIIVIHQVIKQQEQEERQVETQQNRKGAYIEEAS